MQFLEWLWKVVIQEGKDEKEGSDRIAVQQYALSSLQKHFHSPDFFPHRNTWIERLVESIRSGKSVSYCYPLLGHILGMYHIRVVCEHRWIFTVDWE
jgi:hypothetical protein